MEMLEAAESDVSVQDRIREACAESAWFWINGFVFTHLQKTVGLDGCEKPVFGDHAHFPFVTWLVQDEFIGELVHAIENGHDVLINKSRDMGASWLCLTVIHWFWQFRASTTFKEVSRKQELVDKLGDMDSLFEKHRYINRNQPTWLKPKKIIDKLLLLKNEDLDTAIVGESTNQNVGEGGRKTAMLLDEFAKVEQGEKVDTATADVTACRIYNSTPEGPGTMFSRIYRSGRARVLELPWWRHPDKGRDAKQLLDERGKPKWTSPWRENEVKRRDKRNIAQNIDMDHGRSGETFFDADEIQAHIDAHAKAPSYLVSLKFAEDATEGMKQMILKRHDARLIVAEMVTEQSAGKRPYWRMYCPLMDGRPSQQFSYSFGGDVATGSGTSNSVLTALACEPGIIFAKLWSSFLSPEAFAEQAILGAIWFGGRLPPPLIVWENNGPGGIFGRKLFSFGYPRMYFSRRTGAKHETKTERWGWNSRGEEKSQLLGAYREALGTGKIINPCREGLEECLDYIYDETGSIIPGKLKEEKSGGRALHGDHVIADALSVLGRADMPNQTRTMASAPPVGSFAWRRHVAQKRVSTEDYWKP